jgi:uncharacterized protein (TIGR03435 family)
MKLVLASFLLAGFGFAQSPVFEVASVKVSPPVAPGARVYFGPPRGGPGTPDPTQITWSYATLKAVLLAAWDLKAYQLEGPAWLTTERYDLAVRVPAGATKDQVMLMWRNLLAERFGVVVRRETRDTAVEELNVAKGGPHLKETVQDPDSALPDGPPQVKDGMLVSPGAVLMITPGPPEKVHMMARAQPIAYLTAQLSSQRRHPVIDKTGLTGKYDFVLEYALNGPATGSDVITDLDPDLAAAVQRELGLKLTPSRAKIDVMIVEKAEKTPTSN